MRVYTMYYMFIYTNQTVKKKEKFSHKYKPGASRPCGGVKVYNIHSVSVNHNSIAAHEVEMV